MSKDDPVTIIDREVLKVLSADTRMDIIKELKEGARTPSFLSKRLRKSNATIVEHLDTLAKVGLVKKTMAPGKKWVFYSLTERGEGIVSTRNRRLIIILGVSLLMFVGGMASMGGYYYVSGIGTLAGRGTFDTSETIKQEINESGEMPAGAEDSQTVVTTISTTTIPESMPISSRDPNNLYLYIAIFLFSVSATGIGIYLYQKFKYKGVIS